MICSDKTGTPTENQMTVRVMWTPGGRYEATGSGYTPDGTLRDTAGAPVSADVDQALRCSLLAYTGCNDAALTHEGGRWDVVGDPTEGALRVVAAKAAWTLPTNIGEGLVILAAIVAGAALPILPRQILWINMTTAVALGLMLAFEPEEAGIMTRPPRDPVQPLLTRALVVRIALVSTLLVAGAWWLFEWEPRMAPAWPRPAPRP